MRVASCDISTGGGSRNRENHRDFTESTISQTALEIAPLSHPVISAKSSSTRHEFTQDFSKISPTARARSPTAVHGTWLEENSPPPTGGRARSTHASLRTRFRAQRAVRQARPRPLRRRAVVWLARTPEGRLRVAHGRQQPSLVARPGPHSHMAALQPASITAAMRRYLFCGM